MASEQPTTRKKGPPRRRGKKRHREPITLEEAVARADAEERFYKLRRCQPDMHIDEAMSRAYWPEDHADA